MNYLKEHECAQSALWATAYRKYYRLWISLALSTHVTTKQAEDIVHAVVHSAMGREGLMFSSLEHIRNYVSKAVLHRAGQTHQREERTGPWDEHAEIVSGVAPPNELLEDQEQVDILKRVLVKINTRDFEILKLRYFAGLTFSEIGEYLDLPLSTVKSREEAALRRIRRELCGLGVLSLASTGKRGQS